MPLTLIAELPCNYVITEPGSPHPAVIVGGTTALQSEDGDGTYIDLGPFPTYDASCQIAFPGTDVFDVDDTTIWYRLRIVAKLTSDLVDGEGGVLLFTAYPLLSHMNTSDPDTWVNDGTYRNYYTADTWTDEPFTAAGQRAAILAGAGTGAWPGTFGNNTSGTSVRVTYVGLQILTDAYVPPEPPTGTALPAARQWPREDGRGWSSAPRLYPPPKSSRIVGGHQ